MKTLKLSIITLILVFSSVTNVQSEYSMADYRKLKDDKQFDLYLGGYLMGITAANTNLAVRKQPVLFCQPPKLTLNGSNIKQIVNGYWEQKSIARDESISFGLVALEALQDAFPCR